MDGIKLESGDIMIELLDKQVTGVYKEEHPNYYGAYVMSAKARIQNKYGGVIVRQLTDDELNCDYFNQVAVDYALEKEEERGGEENG